MSAKTAKKARSGDVIEIRTHKGFGYVQYSVDHPEYGELIRVFAGVFSERPSRVTDLVAAKASYFVFFPVRAAVHRGRVTVVAHEAIPPGDARPPAMRRPGARDSDGKVTTWIIEEFGSERMTRELTPAERTLSLAVIWNDVLLAERIAQGWTPTEEY